MADASPLEQAAKTAPHEEKKEEPKKIGTLDSVVNEIFDLAKVGAAVAAPFAFGNAFPAMKTDAYVLSGAQVLGDATTARKRGQKFTKTNMLESSLQGLALTPVAAHPLYGVFPLINKIPTNDLMGYVTKGAVWGGVAYPIYMGIYQFFDYLFKNRTFRGLGKYMKENYWTALTTAWKKLFPISLFNIFFAPLSWQVAIGAALSYGLTLFGAPKKGEIKEEEKRDKTPYLVAAPRVLGRGIYNLGKGLYEGAYALGSGLRDTLLYKGTSGSPAAQATPSPAAAPAH